MLSHALRLRPRLAASRPLSHLPSVAGPSSLPRRPICVSSVCRNDDPAPRRTAKYVTEGNRRRKALAKAAALKSMLAQHESAEEAPRRKKDDDDPPTVDDLLALQPEDALSPRRPDYAERYAELARKVDVAFMKSQLLSLCQELKLPVRNNTTKRAMTAMILQSWGWPKPKAPEKAYAQEFSLSSATLFHLQRSVELMEWLEALPGTHVSVTPAKGGDGYILTADGPRAVLDTVNRFLHDFVNTLTIEPLPAALKDMPPRLRWTVSQTTGAWIDQNGLTGSTSEVAAARGMLERVASQLSVTQPPLTMLAREGKYALLPHVPASSSPLPWAEAARVNGRSLFRLSGGREVEGEDLSTLPVLGKKESILSIVPDNGSTLARFGHHLLPSTSSTPSLTPPIPGAHPLQPGSPIAGLKGTVFSPAMPPALVRFPLPDRVRRRRRLTYALPKGKLVVEATYPLREIQAAKKSGQEPHWTELLDQQLKGGDLFAGMDASKDALDRFLAEDDDADDLVDEILGASSSDIDKLIHGGSKPPSSPTTQGSQGAEAVAGSTGAGGEAKPDEKKMLDIAARIERNEVLTDVALPWKPVDVRFVSRSTESTSIPPALSQFFARAAESAEYVTGLALDDVANLRRGAPPKPSIEAVEAAEAESEAAGAGVGEAKVSSSDTIPPAPLRKSAPEAELAPPQTLKIGNETATLVSDEILDVAESVRPHGTGPKPTLRTISAVDLASPGPVLQYAELDGEGLWDEIGSVSRAVGH